MTKKLDKSEAMEQYISEIDRFATMLRDQQLEIARLTGRQEQAKSAYEAARDAVREAKDYEHETVSLLLKFIRPGSVSTCDPHARPRDGFRLCRATGRDLSIWFWSRIASCGQS